VEYEVSHPVTVSVIRWLGKLAILPILGGIAGLLVLAAVFSRGRDTVLLIVSFALQVQVFGFVLELVFIVLMFV
jgi:hypothetical protein